MLGEQVGQQDRLFYAFDSVISHYPSRISRVSSSGMLSIG